MANKVISKYM